MQENQNRTQIFSERITGIPDYGHKGTPAPGELCRRLLRFHGSCSWDAQRLIYPNGNPDLAEASDDLPNYIAGILMNAMESATERGVTLDEELDVPHMLICVLSDLTMLGAVAEASWQTYQYQPKASDDEHLGDIYSEKLQHILRLILGDDDNDLNIEGIFAALDAGAAVMRDVFAEVGSAHTCKCGKHADGEACPGCTHCKS